MSHGICSSLNPIPNNLEAVGRPAQRSPQLPTPIQASSNSDSCVSPRGVIDRCFCFQAGEFLVLATHAVIASNLGVLQSSTWLFASFPLAGATNQTLYVRSEGSSAIVICLFTVGCGGTGLAQSARQVISACPVRLRGSVVADP